MKTTRVPDHRCPICRTELSAASSIATDQVPEPGDWTVCISCCVILRFDDEMVVRLPEKAEIDKLPPEHLASILRVQNLVIQYANSRVRV